jgi:hypothetical protein
LLLTAYTCTAPEQVLLGIRHDDSRRHAKVAGEVADEYAGPVDLAIVTGEDEVRFRAATDDGLVDGSIVADDRTREGAARWQTLRLLVR